MTALAPEQFVRYALECTIYLSPRSLGLTFDEVLEACKQAGYKDGESRDASTGHRRARDGRLQPPDDPMRGDFMIANVPEFRNVKAFDAIVRYLRELAREVGKNKAKVPRDMLVAH